MRAASQKAPAPIGAPADVLPFPTFRRVDFVARNARAALVDEPSGGRRRIDHLVEANRRRMVAKGVQPDIAEADALALRACLLAALVALEGATGYGAGAS